jgi:hypothetical protein
MKNYIYLISKYYLSFINKLHLAKKIEKVGSMKIFYTNVLLLKKSIK